MARLRARTALLGVLLGLFPVVAVAGPALAYTAVDEWHGGATEVGFRWEEVSGTGPYVGEGAGSVPDLIGESSATIGVEPVRRWYDVWSPTSNTRVGLAVGCAGTGDTSSTFVVWLDARTGLGWATAVGDGPGTAGVATVDCTNWGDIIWLGLVVRSWPLLIDEKEEFRVVLEAGSRPVCDLPARGELSRSCYDGAGGEGGIWLVGTGSEVIGGVSTPYLDIGVNLSGCDFPAPVYAGGTTTASGTVDRAYPWQAGSTPVRSYATAVLVVDNVPSFSSQNVYSDATTVAGTASGWAMPTATGSGSTRATPSVLGWTPGVTNGTFRLHLAAPAAAVSGDALYRSAFTASPSTTMASFAAARATSGSGWSLNAGGLASEHYVNLYCVKDSLAVTAGISLADSDASCKEMWVKPQSPDTPTFFPACWDLQGDLTYQPGDTGSITQPDPEGSAEAEGCTISLAGIGCAISEIGDAVDQFIESLTDLPETLFRLAVSIFVPTSLTTELLADLRDSVMTRPPASLLVAAVDLGEAVYGTLSEGSCEAELDLGDLGVYDAPSRCDEEFTGLSAFNVLYGLARAGVWGTFLFALWRLGREAFKS